MIIGSTVGTDGALIQRLPVTTKLAIGLAPSGQRNYPERLDHFVLLKRGPEKGSWVIDEKLMAHYAPQCKHEVADSCANCCREIKILLMDNDPENVFPHELAWWGATKKCWGDGERATRRTEAKPNGEPWTPCRNAGCPDWERGDCSASGDLRFVLADFPVLGSVCRIHTSSLRSVENINSGLSVIQNFTGGRLAGVTVPLCVSMEKTSYLDGAKRKSTIVPILSIRTGVNELIENIKGTMAIFDNARRAFGGKVVPYEEEEDRVAEIPPEFPRKGLPAPAEVTQAEATPKPAEEKQDAQKKKAEEPKEAKPEPKAEPKPDGPKLVGKAMIEGTVKEVKQKKSKGKTYHQAEIEVSAEKSHIILIGEAEGVKAEEVERILLALDSAKKSGRAVIVTCNVYEPPAAARNPVTHLATEAAFKAEAVSQAAEEGQGDFGWMV